MAPGGSSLAHSPAINRHRRARNARRRPDHCLATRRTRPSRRDHVRVLRMGPGMDDVARMAPLCRCPCRVDHRQQNRSWRNIGSGDRSWSARRCRRDVGYAVGDSQRSAGERHDTGSQATHPRAAPLGPGASHRIAPRCRQRLVQHRLLKCIRGFAIPVAADASGRGCGERHESHARALASIGTDYRWPVRVSRQTRRWTRS